MRRNLRPRRSLRLNHAHATSPRPTRRKLRAEPLEARRLLALVPELVADINPQGTFASISQIVALGDLALFVADDGVHGAELWRSDGTSEGTFLLADLNTLTSSSPMVAATLGGHLYFTADDGERGRELWRTDGTAAGTELFWESASGAESLLDDAFAGQFGASEDRIYFTAGDGSLATQLWRTDGTPGGTELAATLAHEFPTGLTVTQGISQLTVVGDRAYFAYEDETHGLELWTSDGTSAGTNLVSDIAPPQQNFYGSYPQKLTPVGNRLYFTARNQEFGRELWRLDAGGGNPERLTNVQGLLDGVGFLQPFGDKLYFSVAGTNADGVFYCLNSDSIVRTARRFASTELSAKENVGMAIDVSRHPGATEDIALFMALHGPIETPNGYVREIELWKTGITEPTSVVATLGTLPANLNGAVTTEAATTSNGAVYLSATTLEHGRELWTSNGKNVGTRLVQDFRAGPADSSPANLTPVGDRLFFTIEAKQFGKELWVTDGTDEGTHVVTALPNGGVGSGPRELTVAGDSLYFTADDGEHGREVWKSDGTAAGTSLVVDLIAGSQSSIEPNRINPRGYLTAFQDHLYFSAVAGSPYLWRSDGTEGGTLALNGPYPNFPQGLFGSELRVVDGRLYGLSGQVWSIAATDAAPELLGSILQSELPPFFDRDLPPFFDQHDSGVAFKSQFGVYVSDGTTAGTVYTGAPNVDSNYVTDFTVVGSTAFVGEARAGVGGLKLYAFDFETLASAFVREIPVVFDDRRQFGFVAVNDTLLFSTGAVREGHIGFDLWRSDGTSEGTVPFKHFRTDSFDFYPTQFTEMNGKLYFSMFNLEHGEELWVSDGTEAGTHVVADIAPGSLSAGINELTAVNGVLYFGANDTVHGTELWRSDGTSTGTFMVADLATGEFPRNSSYPHDFVAFNGSLYFAAKDNVHGEELFRITPPAGDTNFDGEVNVVDLNNVRNNFGGQGLGDTNGDGDVDVADLNAVRNNFGGQDAAPIASLRFDHPAKLSPPRPVSAVAQLAATDLLFTAEAYQPEANGPRGKRSRR
jgi:ELWxxDGT repeat protein